MMTIVWRMSTVLKQFTSQLVVHYLNDQSTIWPTIIIMMDEKKYPKYGIYLTLAYLQGGQAVTSTQRWGCIST